MSLRNQSFKQSLLLWAFVVFIASATGVFAAFFRTDVNGVRTGETGYGYGYDDVTHGYGYGTPTIDSSSSSHSWGGGWGGSSVRRDRCANGDHSGSYYDGKCGTVTDTTDEKTEENVETGFLGKLKNVDVKIFNKDFEKHQCYAVRDEKIVNQGNSVSQWFLPAHQMLYSYYLTMWRGTKDFAPERRLTRQEAAKFMVEFARKVLCRTPNYKYTNQFTDIANANPTLLPYIKQSYEYKIFHGDGGGASKGIPTTFRPFDEISYDELVAVMIRLVRNNYDETTGKNWAKYYKEYIGSHINKSTMTNNVRKNIAETIYDLYKINNYNWESTGFIIVD